MSLRFLILLYIIYYLLYFYYFLGFQLKKGKTMWRCDTSLIQGNEGYLSVFYISLLYYIIFFFLIIIINNNILYIRLI